MPRPTTRIVNPLTGGTRFGCIPETKDSQYGPIFLFHGEEFRGGSGYGVTHIWRRHQRALVKYDYVEREDVSRFVGNILVPGAEVFTESASIAKDRCTVLKNAHGIVIVEERSDWRKEEDPWYSVVTAIPKAKAQGTKIGNLGFD